MTRYKFFNEEALIWDLAEGRLSQGQIARKHKISPSLVSLIRQGKSRPSLKPRIDALRQVILDEGCRLVVPAIKALLAQEAKEGLEGKGETARKCRHYLLDRFLPAESSVE